MRARDQHPQYFDRRVTIRLVVERRTLPLLAESVRYFLRRGVRRIAVAPCLTPDSGWGPADDEILREQLDVIVAASLQHLDATGAVPVSFLMGADREAGSGSTGLHCAAVSGRCACVDAAGQVWGCPLFARSLRRLPLLAEGAAELVSLGSVRDPALTARLAALPERVRQHPLFSADSRRSGAHRCCDCEFAANCLIFPAAVCESGRGLDPHQVPAFHCAFSRVTLDARRRFRDLRARTGPQKCPAELAEALRDVATALRAGDSGSPTSPA
jgi:hypothetical protein